VTDERIRKSVLKKASGTLSTSGPWGQEVAPMRSRIRLENKAPKSMTSEERNSQMPSLALESPVTGWGSTTWGISISADITALLSSETNCGK
jgi:hypothetical protein